VAALRKPSKALWLVNQLARRAPKELRALVEATARIREAQEKGLTGDEVREGMREQRAALQALTAAAGGADLERRIHDTLQASALADPEALLEGRLLEELQPAGFGALLGATMQPLQAKAAAKPHAKEKQSATSEKDGAAAAEKAAAKAAAEKEAAKLAAHAGSLEAAATKAEHAAKEAEAESLKAAKAAEKAAEAAARAAGTATKAREEAKAAREQAIAAKTHFQKMT
jgi:dTMP kinase